MATDDETLVRQARSLFDRGRLEEAAAHYRRLVDARPDDPSLHFGLARTLQFAMRGAVLPDYLEGEEEVGLGYYEGGIIDIREDVRRYLLLEIPVWPVCDGDCRGLCATCGANLNDDPCDCAPSDDESARTPLARELDRLFDN